MDGKRTVWKAEEENHEESSILITVIQVCAKLILLETSEFDV